MTATRIGIWLLSAMALAAVLAPSLAPHDPGRRFGDSQYSPPTPVRIRDPTGAWRAPFFYPQRLTNRLERRYVEDRSDPVPLVWFSGRLVTEAPGAEMPFLPLGADGAGRDFLARLLMGARTSLTIASAALAGAMLLGLALGAAAGASGGRIDDLVTRFIDLLVVLPALYVIVAIRAALPLVVPPVAIAGLIAGVLAVVGAPWIARGVRAILSAEREKEYVEAARAVGASRWRLLTRHLLPATWGFVAAQAVVLLPAFVLAEAMLSFVGLGLPDTTPSWGTSLRDAGTVSVLETSPWLLAPAVAIFLVTLAANAAAGSATGGRPDGAGPRSF